MRHVIALGGLLFVCACSAPPRPGDEDGGSTDAGSTDGGGLGDYRFSYKFGNQITGSELVLDAQGSLDRRERSCCPPNTVDAGVTVVPPSETDDLGGWLASCDGNAEVRSERDGGGAAGDRYGTFVMYAADGGSTTLRRDVLETGYVHAVYKNPCSALPSLIDFVNARVNVDMPDD